MRGVRGTYRDRCEGTERELADHYIVLSVGVGRDGQAPALRGGAVSQGATCVLDVEPHGGRADGRGLLAEPE